MSASPWQERVTSVPGWVLDQEVARRRGEEMPTIALPGLRIDPVAGVVTWRGQDHRVSGRTLEVLYELASMTAQGHSRVRRDILARRVWRAENGWAERDALRSLRQYLNWINLQFPGMIVRSPSRAPDPGTVAFETAASQAEG